MPKRRRGASGAIFTRQVSKARSLSAPPSLNFGNPKTLSYDSGKAQANFTPSPVQLPAKGGSSLRFAYFVDVNDNSEVAWTDDVEVSWVCGP